jgi:5'-3' exonuclease
MILNLLDANSLGRVWNSSPNMAVHDYPNDLGIRTRAIFLFISMIYWEKKKDPQNEFILLWDGKAKFRLEIYPEYKGNRAKKTPVQEEEFQKYIEQVPYIRKAMRYLGVPQLLNSELEADDLAAFLVAHTKDQVRLFTRDQDWLQLVSDRVSWNDSGFVVTPSNFSEKTGVKDVKTFQFRKCLMGDRSDNVKGVPGFGEVRATKFVNEWNSIEDFFNAYPKREKKSVPTWEHNLYTHSEYRETFERNKKLLLLDGTRTPSPATTQKISQKPDFKAFEELCSEFNFIQYINQIEEFKRIFQK